MKNILLALAASVGLSHGASVHTGLLNYWNFEGNANDTAGSIPGNTSTVADNGTVGSAVTSTMGGPIGGYYDFGRSSANPDQIQNVITVADSADIVAAGESLSISAWFRVDSFDQNWQGLIAHGEGSDYRIARRGDGNILGYAGGRGDVPGNLAEPNINDANWHHIVATTTHNVGVSLWIDGVNVTTVADAGTAITDNGSGQLFIGGNPQGDAGATNLNRFRAWNGGIDDVAMWDRALNPEEIGQIYDFGQAGISLAAIPEPSSALLSLLAAGFCFRRRR